MDYGDWTIKFIDWVKALIFKAQQIRLSDVIHYIFKSWENFELLDKILVFEFGLICLGTIAVFFYRTIRRYKRNRVYEARKYLKDYFQVCFQTKKLSYPEGLPPDWHTLEYLIPVMEELQELYQNDLSFWPQMSDAIFEGLLLPIARREANSNSWLERHWALRCFNLAPRNRDLNIMLQFLNDPVPHNRFAIVGTLMSVADKNVIDQLLQVMATESRHSRGLYNIAFKHLSSKLLDHVREYLHSVKDVAIRRICWDILERSPQLTEFNEALKDTRRSNTSLRMSAVRFLAKFDIEQIRPLIYELLEDPQWELRALAAKIIGDKQDLQGLFKLREKLKDPKWWVRMNSALSLEKMGSAGIKVLEQIREEDDRFAYETVKYVLILSKLKSNDKKRANESDENDKSKKQEKDENKKKLKIA